MNYQQRQLEIQEIIKDVSRSMIERQGLDLIDVIVSFHRKDASIEILTDKPNGGVTIDECSALNKEITRTIEEEGLIEENYAISVASPGLDRPLKTTGDFRRVKGKEVEFLLSNAISDQYNYSGIIKEVRDQEVVIKTKENEVSIPLGNIKKAVQSISIK